jgi:hypothetical protein
MGLLLSKLLVLLLLSLLLLVVLYGCCKHAVRRFKNSIAITLQH